MARQKPLVCEFSFVFMSKARFFFLPELSPSSDTDELTVSSSSELLPSCSGKSTSMSSWLLSFFSREWTGIVEVQEKPVFAAEKGLFVEFSPDKEAKAP